MEFATAGIRTTAFRLANYCATNFQFLSSIQYLFYLEEVEAQLLSPFSTKFFFTEPIFNKFPFSLMICSCPLTILIFEMQLWTSPIDNYVVRMPIVPFDANGINCTSASFLYLLFIFSLSWRDGF